MEFKLLSALFGRKSARIQEEHWSPPPKVPDNTQVYAVGDIHGRLDLLRKMHDIILQDAAPLPKNFRRVVVYLGDYIDRGDASKGVIDLLLEKPLPGFESVYLKGNHEASMAEFLETLAPEHPWIAYGGLSTILSYGVRETAQSSSMAYMQMLRDKLSEAIPSEHKKFFTGLRLRLQIGDYFFVHAGVRPGIALDEQNPGDFLWIREPFLSNVQKFEKFIVHGHTITDEPAALGNRIGIDTGAYYSGKLTCLVLAGEEQHFLST